MRRALSLLLFLSLSPLLTASLARAQSPEDIELRKRKKQTKLGFGFMGLYEISGGVNKERPEATQLFYLAPELKIGDKMRARLNFGIYTALYGRQDNPWDLMDLQLQFAHLGFYKEKFTGINFSGTLRYYFPTSKQSRNEGSYGQLRGMFKASRTFWDRLYVAFEFNLQKYFHRYTTWTDDSAAAGGSNFHWGAGFDEVIENNASFGFGEALSATVTALPGLDLSLIYGFYQSRQYSGGTASDYSGSSFAQQERLTRWSYAFRFIADVTYSLGALPWWKGSWVKEQALSRTYLSLGYANLGPELYRGKTNFSPFNPMFGSVYFDLLVLY